MSQVFGLFLGNIRFQVCRFKRKCVLRVKLRSNQKVYSNERQFTGICDMLLKHTNNILTGTDLPRFSRTDSNILSSIDARIDKTVT